MSWRITSALVAVLLAIVIVPGETTERPRGLTLPNILLVTIDTLRADHLSSYGYHWQTSPAIDRLASEGVRFDRAYSVIPLTGPSHFSIFTGRYPQEHGARINGVAVPEATKWVFLPQILQKLGYTNVAYVSAWPLTSHLTRLDRWFEVYDEDLTRKYQVFNSSRYAEDVLPRAVSWLNQNNAKSPFFMWVHFFDPHSPYSWREAFGSPKPSGHKRPGMAWRSSSLRQRIKNYDSEISYTDHHVGKLLEAIDRNGLRESTLVILTSDHGEGLGEKGYVGHGRRLYESILRVPLIMRFPNRIPEGKVIRENVSLLDVTPTVLGLVTGSGSTDHKSFAGLNLVPAIERGERMPRRPVRSVTFGGKKGWTPGWLSWIWTNQDRMPLRLARLDGHTKWVWSPRENRLFMVETDKDPFDLTPQLLHDRSKPYEEITSELKHWFLTTDVAEAQTTSSRRDEDILRSLGYTQ
jgi:arylsulfatase A-like enzyme